MKKGIYILTLLLLLFSGCKKEDEIELFKAEFEVFVLLPTGGLGDRSFADAIYEGCESTVSDFNAKMNYIVPENKAKSEEWIQSIPDLRSNNDLPIIVIIAGSQYIQAVNALNGNFGSHKILFIGGNLAVQENLASVTYRTYAPSYIGGFLSAQWIPNCRALIIAGFDAHFLKEYEQGFAQGVIDAGGTINESVYLSTDFSGFEIPDVAYSVTNSLLSENDLIFALSAGSNSGIINAARNYTEQRYVVGVDADQSWMGLNVVTGSVLKLFDLDIYEYIKQFSQGRFLAGDYVRSMEEAKTAFHINEIVLKGIEIPEELIQIAIAKENQMNK